MAAMAPARVRFLEEARRLLCALGDHVREALAAARAEGSDRLSKIAAVTSADTIYAIDRVSEASILEWFAARWPQAWPVEIVMEGLEQGEPVTFPAGTPVAKTAFKCILDPIDGTRGIMYDKRPAWSLAGLAPQRGSRTNLRDIVVAAMTELPTSKQGRADQLSAVRGRGVVATSIDCRPEGRKHGRPARDRFDARPGRPCFPGAAKPLRLRPSRASDCRHGFASFAKFFPEGRVLTARIEEELWTALYGAQGKASPVIFDDQYISTGGQLYELACGHDRMIADIRPPVFEHLGLPCALVCHPYDICTALVLEEAGGVVEAPGGGRLSAPLDTTTPVAWVGYANRTLARAISPELRRVLKRRLG